MNTLRSLSTWFIVFLIIALMISVGAAAPSGGTFAGKPPTKTPTPTPGGPTPTNTPPGPAPNVTISNTIIGQSPTSIGAVEACTRFNIADLLDWGAKNYRIYADMARFEPVDDDGVYGSPTIAQIKANPNIIPFAAWDAQFDRTDAYFFEPGCSPLGTSNKTILTTLKANGIRPILGVRNVDNKGTPTWMSSNPQTTADWNEWWEYVFGLVYTINVRYNLDINDWQVHNQPDNTQQGWSGTQADYMIFTQQTYDAIKYVYDTYLPGKTFRLYAPVSTHADSWVTQTLITNDAIVDVIDWHRYGPPADQAMIVHDMIATNNSDGVLEQLHISEWGSLMNYNGAGRGYADWLLSMSLPASKVDFSSIFSMYDWGSTTCCLGIVRADGTKTATFYALRMVIRATQSEKNVYQINTSVTKSMLATKDPVTGKLYYTIINDGAQPISITLDVGAHLTTGTATIYQHDDVTFFDTQTGTASITNGRVSFTVPKRSNMQLEMQ